MPIEDTATHSFTRCPNMMKKWSSRTKRNSVAPERSSASSTRSKNNATATPNNQQAQLYQNQSSELSKSSASLESQMTMNPPIITSESHASLQSSLGVNSTSKLSTMNSSSDKNDDNTLNLSHTTNTTTTKTRPFTYETYDTTMIKTGWINKGHNMVNWANASADSWRVYRAVLEGPVLSLYKLPADLNVKSFDSSMGATSASDSLGVRQRRMSQASRSDLKSSIRAQQQQQQKVPPQSHLKYISEVYPHPELELNESNAIVSGSLESICHTILFNTLDDDKLSYSLLLILPLFGDPKQSLVYFIEYANAIVAQSRISRSGPTGNVVVSNNTDYAITQRLGLVITTIVDSFPGMLLDVDMIELLTKLLIGIAHHDERLAQKLKLDLNKREVQMKALTDFRTVPYSTNGSQDLTDVLRFLQLDSYLLASQVNIIDLKFNNSWNPKSDASLLYELNKLTYSKFNPLIFNSNTSIHYLGRLIVNHLFGSAHNATRQEIQRARVLEKWIEIGCIFDRIGDMVSWLAIATVICSMPVLRLKRTWSHVDDKSMKIITSEWAPVVFELDRRNMMSEASHRSSYHVIAPQGLGVTYSKMDVVPYFGDLTVKYTENSTLKQCEKKVQRVKISFSRWNEYLSNLKEDDSSLEKNPKIEDAKLQKQLYNLLTNHASLEPLTLGSVMELSLCTESDSVGPFQRIDECKTPLETGAFLPTLFVEPLPTYRLFDQQLLIGAAGFNARAHVNGDSEVTTMKLSLTARDTMIQEVKDTFNSDVSQFHVENELIFKSMIKGSSSSSVLIENPSLHLLTSNNNSNNTRSRQHPKKNDDDGAFAIFDNSDLLNSVTKPINVVLRAGTFDKMVDALVLTANVFSKMINKRDAEDFLLKNDLLDKQSLKLKMDNDVYTSTFFATYKSFTTTPSLLEALKKRFVGAKSGAMSITSLNDYCGTPFPEWGVKVASDDLGLNWIFVGNIQVGVLEAIAILVTEHYSDFTSDLKNKQIFVDLLRIIDYWIAIEWREVLTRFENDDSIRHDLDESYSVLTHLYKKIRKTFIKKCYRPVDVFPRHIHNNQGSFPPVTLPSEFREAEAFVESLDSFIHGISSAVSIADWLHVSHLIETYSNKSLVSMFKYKKPSPDPRKLSIMNVFCWIRGLHGDNLDDTLLDKFPSPVQTLITAHSNLENYFKSQICDLHITRKDRHARMVAICQILTITKLRMENIFLFDNFSPQTSFSPSAPSFIETAITQAIVSPESRAFDCSWALFGDEGLCSSVSQLLMDLDGDDLADEYIGSLTPCPGWAISRLMEISNFVPSETDKLVNFDKRRFVFNCVTKITDLSRTSTSSQSCDQFGFLLDPYSPSQPDIDDVLLVAHGENRDLLQPASPFLKTLLDSEIEKNRRDALKKEELENQERDLKRAELLSRASSSSMAVNETEISPVDDPVHRKVRHSSSSPTKTTGMKRFGGLFRSVRPFSINVGSGWSGPDRVVHPDDLPDVYGVEFNGKHSKPYQQIMLFRYKPLFVHTKIEGFFKLVSDDGGEEFHFQAPSNREAQNWISALNMSKRYTYLSKDSSTISKVFGVPISDVCEREGTLVPAVVEKLLNEIEMRGLDETGLYRIPGSVGSINLLKQAFDDGAEVSLNHDIHTLGGCFKAYLRDLPETLLTNELLPEFVLATKQGDLVPNLRVLVLQLPVHNYHVLKRLFYHLHNVVEHSEKNRMDAVNLAIVFSMSFLDNDNIGTSMGSDLGALQNILQCLIRDPSAVFAYNMEDQRTVFST